MAVICPAVLAWEPHDYREQMERIAPFARRVQIDLTDGLFASRKTIDLDHVWWPHGMKADLHMMYKRPDLYLDKILELNPALVIIHAEAEGSFEPFAAALHKADIKVGVALLPMTKTHLIESTLDSIDHVLIFSGDLGYFGGHADLTLLNKVERLRNFKPELEIGWDGGVTDENAAELIEGGVNVLNVGGFIQRSDEPQAAYATLQEIAEG